MKIGDRPRFLNVVCHPFPPNNRMGRVGERLRKWGQTTFPRKTRKRGLSPFPDSFRVRRVAN
jgi:hypothetical protein